MKNNFLSNKQIVKERLSLRIFLAAATAFSYLSRFCRVFLEKKTPEKKRISKSKAGKNDFFSYRFD